MKIETAEQNWTRVIKPKTSLLDIDLKNVWRYRDLIYMYVKRDIVVQYKQTILGPVWYFVQPIMTTIMFMFVFGGIAQISTDGMPQPLFYMAGLLLWNYFSSCFTASSDIFGSNSAVFGKVYFPLPDLSPFRKFPSYIELSIYFSTPYPFF